MYAVSASADAAWKALLGHVLAQADCDMPIVDFGYPNKLADLWGRDDLGCVLMCGWPFVREGASKTLLAAPVPDAEWASDRAQYRSEFIVARESPFRSVEDARGRRFAFNSRDSHSGWNAPRGYFAADPEPAFAEVVGPFVTHQRVVEAVASGAAELAAIDSLTMLLLRRHDAALAGRVRVVGATAPCPIPAFVANAVTAAQAGRLREALTTLHHGETGRGLLGELCLRRFDAIAPTAYAATLAVETQAVAKGYLEIA